MSSLPTPAEMLAHAGAELNKAYRALSGAGDWLRSDWPAGSEMTAVQAEQRTRMFRAIHDAKAAINVGRDARRDVRGAEAVTARTVAGDRLPRRQRQIITLIGAGFTNPQIAAVLGISLSTVKNHVELLCRNVGADNRWQALCMAWRAGEFW